MGQALNVHRLHFAFTITFHYIFPQLTMGLALLLVYLKTKAQRTGDEHYNRAARFWGRIFGINFAVGVITGIPMEFQFGTNWAAFSKAAGGVIGQTLAMEGVFSFFLESSFLGIAATNSSSGISGVLAGHVTMRGPSAISHIIKGRPFGVGFECLAHSLQERNTLYD